MRLGRSCLWFVLSLSMFLYGTASAAPPDPAGVSSGQEPPAGAEGVPAWLPRYDLDIQLDVDKHEAKVHQRVTWTNRHQRPATELVFNAHSHYTAPDGEIGLLAKTLEILRMTPSDGLYTAVHPCEITKIMLGRRTLDYYFKEDNATALVVPLPQTVGPNETVTLDIDFTMHLPQKQGRWGQWNGVTFLSNWLPVLAFYDDDGWQPTPFIPWHQPFFNEAGIYTARVTLPADEKIACSGSITAARDAGNGLKQVDIVARGVRDFAFLCSKRYEEYTAEISVARPESAKSVAPQTNTPFADSERAGQTIKLHCLAFPEHEHYAREMLKTAAEVIPVYGKWFGPYAYPDFTIAESYFGWNGNQCATLVMIDERVFAMPHLAGGYVEYLISHEICHQWWYNAVGNNGYCETWMDEALAVYFSHRLMNQKRP